MKITHLISTMRKSSPEFVENMKLTADATVVNQTDTTHVREESVGDIFVKMYSTNELGLSNSRNMLLDRMEGDIALIGDDDIVYLDGYAEKIRQAYGRYPDADIIAFSFTQSLGEDTRRQFKKTKKISIFNISKIASVEISFKVESVRRAGLRFDTLLGLGAPFGSAEENAFLADALRAGLKIIYVPMTLCYLLPDSEERVKWKDGFGEEYFTKKGACFFRIYGRLFLPFAAAFVLSKKRTLFRGVRFSHALGWMKNGKKRYKELR